MAVIALAAPVISVIWPSLAVVAGAIAGAWIFLGRTILTAAQTKLTTSAACVQEQFDFYVFGMPDAAPRSTLPTLEKIASFAGPDESLVVTARKEKLLDWYPIDEGSNGCVSVAIAQRANASYADQLLRTTAIMWSIVTVVWVIALVVVSIVEKVSLATFMLGIVLPVLPALLDVGQYVGGFRQSATERSDLARDIKSRIDDTLQPPAPQELLVWQDRLFELRRSTPDVPDFIYKMKRRVNERAMHSAARQLSDKAKSMDK